MQEPIKVVIPRYVLRGQGKDEHFEFEVKVSCVPSAEVQPSGALRRRQNKVLLVGNAQN